MDGGQQAPTCGYVSGMWSALKWKKAVGQNLILVGNPPNAPEGKCMEWSPSLCPTPHATCCEQVVWRHRYCCQNWRCFSLLWKQTGLICFLIACPQELWGFICAGWELGVLLCLIVCSFAPVSKISLVFHSLLCPISWSCTPAWRLKPRTDEGFQVQLFCRVFQQINSSFLCQTALAFKLAHVCAACSVCWTFSLWDST